MQAKTVIGYSVLVTVVVLSVAGGAEAFTGLRNGNCSYPGESEFKEQHGPDQYEVDECFAPYGIDAGLQVSEVFRGTPTVSGTDVSAFAWCYYTIGPDTVGVKPDGVGTLIGDPFNTPPSAIIQFDAIGACSNLLADQSDTLDWTPIQCTQYACI